MCFLRFPRPRTAAAFTTGQAASFTTAQIVALTTTETHVLTANPDRPVWPVWMRHHAWNTRHARQSHAHAAPAPRPLPH
jgi:hypothetical protein